MSEKIIIELAGRDSFAAFLKYFQNNEVKEVIPTIAKAPSEYGSFEIILNQLNWLKEKLTNKPVFFSEPEILEDHKLWWILNGRYLSEIIHRYGFFTPCVGCHLYFHLLRVELALKERINKVISGERELHASRVKINQVGKALDAYQEVLSQAKIELIFPVRKITSDAEIEKILGKKWEEGKEQLSCVFKANYCSIDNQLLIDPENLTRYLRDFLIPVGKIIVQAKLDKKHDYHLEIEDYLKKKWAAS